MVVDSPGQLKGFRGSHAGNMPAKQVNDLLIRVTIAIVNDDFSFKVAAGVRTGFQFRDFRHFCWGKRAHTVLANALYPSGAGRTRPLS